MNIVTGYKGEPHVTAWQDRDLNQGIFGADTYILNVGSKLAASIISNNEIHIADGVIMMQGCEGVVQKGTYDTISIDNGSQGMLRNDLICIQYSKASGTSVETLSWVVIKGTPAASSPSDPSYTSGDIQNGDTLVQVPIYRVVLNGLSLTDIETMSGNFQYAGTISSARDYAHQFDGTVSAPSGFDKNTTVMTISGLDVGTYMIVARMTSDDIDSHTMVGMVSGSGSYIEWNGFTSNPVRGNGAYGIYLVGLVNVVRSQASILFRVSHNLGYEADVSGYGEYMRIG